ERYLLAHSGAPLVQFLVVAAHDHERRRGDGEILACAAGLSEPFLDMREHEFAQVFGRIKWMGVKAVAQLAGQSADIPIHTRDIDGNFVLMRSRSEKRRHQAKVIVLALVSELRAAFVPALEYCRDRFQVLAQFGNRRVPSHPVTSLDMPLDLSAEPKDE